eukprot:TRINITY_DN6603_c0_g1_i1.p1 TRINITY_DN6603_c0_g1~~TRINITY_DN6603_c0_g1_i1.p1  ORF type:complete len:930 (+),score=179.22 TRINITY_DN6603_c0_g1_i1:365-3154(+)
MFMERRVAWLLLSSAWLTTEVGGIRIGDDQNDILVVNDTETLDSRLAQQILQGLRSKCKARLAKCGLEEAAKAVCSEDARFNSITQGVRDAYKQVITNWNACFNGTNVPKMNIFYMVMDEVVTDVIPPGFQNRPVEQGQPDEKTTVLLQPKASLTMGQQSVGLGDGVKGAWGATQELLDMLQPRHKQVEKILKKWHKKLDGSKDKSAFHEIDGVNGVVNQGIGEFPWMYSNALVGGLKKLGFSEKEILGLNDIQVHGYRVRMEDSKLLNKQREDWFAGQKKANNKAAESKSGGGEQSLMEEQLTQNGGPTTPESATPPKRTPKKHPKDQASQEKAAGEPKEKELSPKEKPKKDPSEGVRQDDAAGKSGAKPKLFPQDQEGAEETQPKPLQWEKLQDQVKDELAVETTGGVKVATLQESIKSAFEGADPAVILSSGSRWDAWAEKTRGYASAGSAAYVQWQSAKSQISICYSHQSNAHQHPMLMDQPPSDNRDLAKDKGGGQDGEVAPHSWEVGARPNNIDSKFSPIFAESPEDPKGPKAATLSYVHFDEVIKPGKGGVAFIGNPHTKYEGMVYPTAVTTQGHPEVPLLYDIAMVGSCSLWPYFYWADRYNNMLPEGYCADAYGSCGDFFGKYDLTTSFQCLKTTENDGWESPEPSDTVHENGQQAGKGKMVKPTGAFALQPGENDTEHRHVDDDTRDGSFEKDCTKCFGNVQWNQLLLLVKSIFETKACSQKGKAMATSLTEKIGGGNGKWKEIEAFMASNAKGKGLNPRQLPEFLPACDEHIKVLEQEKPWKLTFKASPHKDSLWMHSPRYDGIDTEEENTKVGQDSLLATNATRRQVTLKKQKSFHYLNKCTWAFALVLMKKDAQCFADTLADILPDARKVAEMWVRNIVTSNLMKAEDTGSSGGDSKDGKTTPAAGVEKAGTVRQG